MSAPMTAQKAAGGTLILTAAFANPSPVGTRVNVNIQWDPSISAASYVIVPDSEYWLITDVWALNATDATAVNPTLEFYKDQDRVLDRSKPLLTVLVTSAQRPPGLNSNLGYQGGSHMTVKAVANVAGAAVLTMRAYASFEKHS